MQTRASSKEAADPKPWKSMVKLKRYPYHTLFLNINRNGTSYCESFLNSEIDEGKKNAIPGRDRQGYRENN